MYAVCAQSRDSRKAVEELQAKFKDLQVSSPPMPESPKPKPETRNPASQIQGNAGSSPPMPERKCPREAAKCEWGTGTQRQRERAEERGGERGRKTKRRGVRASDGQREPSGGGVEGFSVSV